MLWNSKFLCIDLRAGRAYNRGKGNGWKQPLRRVKDLKQLRKILVALLIAVLCVSTVVTALADTVTMTGNGYLRSGAGKGYSIKATIKKGKTATYLNKYKKDSRGVYWLKVKYGSKTGWVSTRYCRLGKTSSKVVKTTGKAHVRLAPKKSAKSLGVVGKGKTLTYRGKKKKDSRGVTWYHVSFNGQNGWISSKYAKLK